MISMRRKGTYSLAPRSLSSFWRKSIFGKLLEAKFLSLFGSLEKRQECRPYLSTISLGIVSGCAFEAEGYSDVKKGDLAHGMAE